MSQIDPQIARWFRIVDKQNRGRLNVTELQHALRNNNYSTFDITCVQLMIDMFDRDKSKTISLSEFCDLWRFLGQWRQVFDRFDVDRSGSIDMRELAQAHQQLGYHFSQQFAGTILQKFDYRKSGSLQFDGFVHSLLLIQRLTGAFQPFDTRRDGNAHFTYEQFLTTVLNNT